MQTSHRDWHELPLRSRSRPALTAAPEDSLSEVSGKMQQHGAGCILLCREGRLSGILTDKDLRRAAASGRDPLSTPASRYMSSPVRTFPPRMSVGAAQIAMLRYNISHLVLTRDGTPGSPPAGVVTQRDLLITQSHSPALLLQDIRKADSLEELVALRGRQQELLAEYMEQRLPPEYTAEVSTALTDALVCRVIERVRGAQGSLPDLPFAWLAIGSLGRGEQLLSTDQDNALVFGDPAEGEPESARERFAEFARAVNADLEVLGFEKCPAGMMAGNPKWCLPLSGWKETFSDWIHRPDESALLHSSIFFDYRLLYGDSGLEQELSEHVRIEATSASLFISYLGINALREPPARNWLGRLRTERSGRHKGRFDIKARGLMPLTDAARTLCFALGHLQPTGTIARFAYLAREEPQNEALYTECQEAFTGLLILRTRSGLNEGDSGRYIDPALLGRADRARLNHWLRCIRKIQQLLLVRFRLAEML